VPLAGEQVDFDGMAQRRSTGPVTVTRLSVSIASAVGRRSACRYRLPIRGTSLQRLACDPMLPTQPTVAIQTSRMVRLLQTMRLDSKHRTAPDARTKRRRVAERHNAGCPRCMVAELPDTRCGTS